MGPLHTLTDRPTTKPRDEERKIGRGREDQKEFGKQALEFARQKDKERLLDTETEQAAGGGTEGTQREGEGNSSEIIS